MLKRTAVRALGASLAVLVAAASAPTASQAAPVSDGGDPSQGYTAELQTPDNNALLPLINVQRPSTRLKPNLINPHPVCNSLEDHRTVIYQVQDNFTPIGAIETKNSTKAPIQLAQELSKTQSIKLSISGDYSKSFASFAGSLTAVADKLTGNASITGPQEKLGIQPSVEYSISWTAGQQIGPYEVPAGYTGKAVYGFRTLAFKGTQQYCKANGTWSTPWAYYGLAPLSNAVVVKLYDNVATEATGTH